MLREIATPISLVWAAIAPHFKTIQSLRAGPDPPPAILPTLVVIPIRFNWGWKIFTRCEIGFRDRKAIT